MPIANTIVSRAVQVLHDAGYTRWPSSELLQWSSDGQLATAHRIPSAYQLEEDFSLAIGPSQTLPNNTLELIDVLYNVATGYPIHKMDRSVLDIYRAYETASDVDLGLGIESYYYDPRNRKHFIVAPAPTAAGATIRIVRGVLPDALTSLSSSFQIDDRYVEGILDYVLFRAFGKDSEDASSRELSQKHYQAWVASLTQNRTGASNG